MINIFEKFWCYGECYCGEVVFVVNLFDYVVVLLCNCLICVKMGFIYFIVEKFDFKIECGVESLIIYIFGLYEVKYMFCLKCGVKFFYVLCLYLDGWLVNLCVLDVEVNL